MCIFSRITYYLLAITLTSGILFAQETDIGVAEREIGDVTPVTIQSPDKSIADLAERAFSIHGGFSIVASNQSAFVFDLERASNSSVLLIISSGEPAVELFRRTVPGSNLQNATLKACDIAVEATTQKKGFFAGRLAFIGKQRGVAELYTTDLLFTNVRPLTRDRALLSGPSWSPDGSKLIYTTYYKSGFPDIYAIDLRAGLKTPIATFKGTNNGAEYSPDGNRIAMSLSGTGNAEIYVSSAKGKGFNRLTSNRSIDTSPTWSPDGRRLIYTSDTRGKPELYEIAANGGPARRIATNISSYCSEPDWNPVDENLVVFTAAMNKGFQVALYDMSKKKSKWLTSVQDSAVEPTWLNDGRHLVFTQREKGRTRLMLLDSESGKVSPLHQPNFGDAYSATFVY